MSLTEKLITLREEKGLTQEEAAERLEVSRQAVSRWELGTATPTIEKLKGLSKLYGVPLSTLLDDEEELPRQEESKEANEAGKQIVSKKFRVMAILVVIVLIVLTVAFVFAKVAGEKDGYQIKEMERGEIETNQESSFNLEW